ncbi:MAG: hypothetical protein HGB10_10990 [Coriobacteriia bacterium]|nr:hypothetical protein [Coriobacteriia bacterium]
MWRSTYASHLSSFERYSDHDVFYLNTAWPTAPGYLKRLDYDLVIFHYTFLAVRWVPEEFDEHLRRIAFLANKRCPKALVPHDEQIHANSLVRVVNELGVTHVFSPASAHVWAQIYEGADTLDSLEFRTVLTGYVDAETVAATEKRAATHPTRHTDVGYRSWDAFPNFGRHGQLKGDVGRRFAEHAPEYGLVTDISSSRADALLGDSWFDFLLDCRYTIGVEGGSSILDRDGSIAARTREFVARHPDAGFDEVETACFPGIDGSFEYRLLGPRHLEAAMTRTCQVLIEGEYGGALTAGEHYIPLAADFSNLDEVLAMMKADDVRAEMVERAYRDVIASGRWSYETFARELLATCLAGTPAGEGAGARGPAFWLGWNRAGVDRVPAAVERTWLRIRGRARRKISVRDIAVLAIGEERLWRTIVGSRNLARKLTGKSPLAVGDYVPTEAEAARRAARAAKRGQG